MTADPLRSLHIGLADIQRPDIQELILLHRRAALAANRVCEDHAMRVEDYLQPNLTLFAARDREQGDLLAICGLMTLTPKQGELKTMHTRDRARGRGAGRALLAYLIQQAHDRGFEEIYLETGTSPFFASAIRLYHRFGFQDCDAFAAYAANPDSRFMRLTL